MKRRSHGEGLALEEMVRLVRREPPPDVDWETLERRLRSAMEEDTAPAQRPRARRTGPQAFVLAAAAVLVVAVVVFLRVTAAPDGGVSAQAPVAAPGPTTDEPGSMDVDGTQLQVRREVTALDEPKRVVHRDLATWVLDPGGSAHIVRVEPLTVQLVEGALTASVRRSTKPESFVVVADHLRIAVHGTRFRVVREEAAVVVEVFEGVVGVRPVDDEAAVEEMLRAPVRRSFSVQSADLETQAPAPETSTSASARVRPHNGPQSVPELSDEQIQMGSARIVDAVTVCFRQNTAGGPEVRLSMTTTLSVTVTPDGKVLSALFQPPLAPAVERCAARAIDAVHFPESKSGTSIQRPLVIER